MRRLQEPPFDVASARHDARDGVVGDGDVDVEEGSGVGGGVFDGEVDDSDDFDGHV